MNSVTTSPRFSYRASLVLIALFGLLGLGVSGYLTVLKFAMTYTPCRVPGGCQVGGLGCDDALRSAWSVVGGLPVSAWGSAVYLCITLLALGLLARRDFLRGCAVATLWILSLAAAAVSLVYATYAFLILGKPCPFCLSLYVVASVLVGAVAVARRAALPSVQFRLRHALRRRRASLVDAAFAAAMCLVVAAGVQSLAYHGLRHVVSQQDGCPQVASSWPPASIRFGASDPEVILAVYLDPSCSACKRRYKELTAALRESPLPARVQVWVYLVPREVCDPMAFQSGYANADDRAISDHACLAAHAALCVEKLRPGAGLRMLDALFKLHDVGRSGPLFTTERVGNQAVLSGLEIDPDDADNELRRCIDTDQDVLAEITAHQRHAEASGTGLASVAVLATEGGVISASRGALWIADASPLGVLARFVNIQAKPPSPSW